MMIGEVEWGGNPSTGPRSIAAWEQKRWRRARWRRACLVFFQAEDGIRDLTVTGVQTCALPICLAELDFPRDRFEVIVVDDGGDPPAQLTVRESPAPFRLTVLTVPHAGPSAARNAEIGRASCRERV